MKQKADGRCCPARTKFPWGPRQRWPPCTGISTLQNDGDEGARFGQRSCSRPSTFYLFERTAFPLILTLDSCAMKVGVLGPVPLIQSLLDVVVVVLEWETDRTLVGFRPGVNNSSSCVAHFFFTAKAGNRLADCFSSSFWLAERSPSVDLLAT